MLRTLLLISSIVSNPALGNYRNSWPALVSKEAYGDKFIIEPPEYRRSNLLNALLERVPNSNHDETNGTVDRTHTAEQSLEVIQDGQSMGDVVFNVHHFTQCQYNEDQVYIYSPKKNDENHDDPRKWTFFYVPVLQPVKPTMDSPWVWIHKNEIRVRLTLSTPELEKLVRKAVTGQYDNETITSYSHLWVIAPLMMDSLSAYIVGVG